MYKPIATKDQWEDFLSSLVWQDLKSFIEGEINTSRDLLEGLVTMDPEDRIPSDDELRGSCRSMRWLLNNIEGWASGMIPIPTSQVTGSNITEFV